MTTAVGTSAAATMRTSYDNVGNVIGTKDAEGRITKSTYDATKHRTSASLYDAIDRIISSTDTFSQNTTYTYLDTARKKLTLTPLGLLTTETTDTAGNLTEIIDSIHPATRYQYDKRNRKTKIIDATGGETFYTYYLDGQTKSVTDAVNNITTYFYDTAGRLIQENSPLGSRQYQYDLVNNRIQGKDRNGRITKYGYDNLNRVKSELWVGDGQTFTYAYDKNSNLTSTQDGNIRYEYAYDNTDLLEKVDRISGTNPKVTFKYTYDEIGNLTIAEELIANNLKATTSYEYADPRYLNTKITQTGVGLASKQVKFTYDATGLNRKVERYLDGLLKLTTTNAFDTYGRLTGIKQENNSGATIANDIYDLDNLNRLQAQTKDGNARSIVYDNTDQVKTVTGSNSEAYTYDLNGNRMGGGYVTDTGNRLMSDGVYSYEYDAEGWQFTAGQVAGFGVSVALGFVTPNALTGVGAAARIAQGYELAQAGIGAYNTTTKILDGKMDWRNPLSYLEVAGSFAPAIGAGARQVGKFGVVENAIAKATAVGENIWNSASQKASDSFRKWVIQQAIDRRNGWTSETGAIDPRFLVGENIVDLVQSATTKPIILNDIPAQFSELINFRQQLGLLFTGIRKKDGVITKLELNDKVYFGINTWAGSDVNATRLFKQAKFVNPKTNKNPYPAVANHAEGDVALQAFLDNNTGGHGKLYIDTQMCGFCDRGGGVKSLARGLGLESLEIFEKMPDNTIKYRFIDLRD